MKLTNHLMLVISSRWIFSPVQAAFSKPKPIGVFTGWQRATGQQFTPAGRINMSTGEFVKTGINKNQPTIYTADAAINGLGASAAVSAVKSEDKK